MLRCVLYVFGVLLISGLSFGIVEPGPKIVPTKGELWPKAHFQKKSNQYFTFNPSQFTVNTTKETCDLLARAIQRYSFIVRSTNNLKRLSPARSRRGQSETGTTHTDDHQGLVRELVVELDAPCGDDYPYYNMDESYDLVISTRSRLSSVSVWGILRGLETWSQLFYISDDYKEVYINATHITDFPRYAHRGLLLDTSRHFISLANILKTLDAMAMNKMNVFHWHIVDDQSFPYQSEKFPELSAKGAYHPTMVYTKADIEKVVQYARDRGIRVLPEIDVPGHTRSWGASHPDLLAKCYLYNKVAGLGPMDPTNAAVYTMLEELIQEVQEWFPDKYFHVGGDEVEMDCWSSNPDLKKYMKEHNMTTAQLHALFMQKVIPLLGNRSKPIVWQEVFDEGVPLTSDTLVQVWKWGWTDAMVNVLKAGHKVLFSASWYLDHLKTGGDWTDFFLADPRQMVSDRMGNTTVVTNIVGGEACMWGEVVDDTNVMSRTWPRTSAAAERLWSPGLADGSSGWLKPLMGSELTAEWLSEAAHRLEEHACRMRRRGVRAQPPNGPGYCAGAL